MYPMLIAFTSWVTLCSLAPTWSWLVRATHEADQPEETSKRVHRRGLEWCIAAEHASGCSLVRHSYGSQAAVLWPCVLHVPNAKRFIYSYYETRSDHSLVLGVESLASKLTQPRLRQAFSPEATRLAAINRK